MDDLDRVVDRGVCAYEKMDQLYGGRFTANQLIEGLKLQYNFISDLRIRFLMLEVNLYRFADCDLFIAFCNGLLKAEANKKGDSMCFYG